MKSIIKYFFTVILCTSYFTSLSQQMPPKYEFRAVWIATVNNIDWPSSRFDSPDKQKREFRAILDKLKASGINAVIVQVRAAADAFYQSPYEPWSQWLTGRQGQPPTPFYDPLKFMIQEAHERGMEFHAWINPYRAVANIHHSDIHAMHITNRKPAWFLEYGHLKIFNPGIPEARDYIVKIIKDIVYRYDVDGIHFDDYFYPYPSNTHKLQDTNTFYRNKNGFRYKSDWRRNNVNMLIKEVHEAIVSVNPRVKFGVSPFGVWRNNNLSSFGSRTNSGITSYDHLHADVRLWLEMGWVDYVAPQLYQNIKHKNNPYKELVRWWSKNAFGKHLYIGHAAYRLFWDSNRTWYDYQEMPNQIRHLRKFSHTLGSVFYSCKAILRNKGALRDSLQSYFYQYPALVPPMAWKDSIPPIAPKNIRVSNTVGQVSLHWDAPERAKDGDLPFQYVVYRFKKGENVNIQNPTNIVSIQQAEQTMFIDWDVTVQEEYTYIVTALDRLHNESELPVERVKTVIKKKVEKKIPPKPKFDSTQPVVSKYPYTYEEAAHLYKIALKSSKEYLGIP